MRTTANRRHLGALAAAAPAVLLSVLAVGCGGGSHPSPPGPRGAEAAFRAALRRTLDSPSFTVLVRGGPASFRPGALLGAGIYQDTRPVRAELVQRIAGSFGGPAQLQISFAIGRRLYALYKHPVIQAQRDNGVSVVIDPVRGLLGGPLVGPRTDASWTRHGDTLVEVASHGEGMSWTVELQKGRIASITQRSLVGRPKVVTFTTVFGFGVSVVPSPSNAAAEEAAALIGGA